MHTRKLIAAAGAVVAALSLTAAPAYANGISVHKAGQQYEADLHAIIGPFEHAAKQDAVWAKNPNRSDATVGYIFNPMAEAVARLGHEMRTQRWPSQDTADIHDLEADTTFLREDLQQVTGLNTSNANSWEQTTDTDITNWENDSQDVAKDLRVTLPSAFTS